MRNEIRTNLAASLAALLLLATPVAASTVDNTSPAGRLREAPGSTAWRPAAQRQPADSAMPAMLQVAVTRSEAADVASAYHIEGDGRGTNPQHGFDLAFTPRGARVDGSAGGFALHLERFGRGDGRPVRRVAPHIDGAWVEYDRGAGLNEWFVNLPHGVEQGWTVSRRPAGEGPLVLELDTARPPDARDHGRLAWSGLVYHRLVALDADGRELPAAWTQDGSRLRIEVDDRHAAYPVLIDPWVQQAKLTTAGGAPDDAFGASVAVAGNTAVVGAPFLDVDGNVSQGTAYVFTRVGTAWSQQAELTAADGAAGDVFGTSVAIAGDTAVVAATGADVGGNSNQGAAYVFTRSGTAWSQQAKLTANDGAAGNGFGRSVAVAGDSALVGVPAANVGGNNLQGAVYVFVRSGAVWSQQAKLTASDGAASDRPQLGISVSLAGDTAVAGAFGAEVNGNTNQGAAYVFTRSGAVWSQQAKLTAVDGAATDEFGVSVAVDGNTALVGAFGDNANLGSAYVFTRSGTAWSQQARLDPAGAGGRFGVSVSLAGNTALVGAFGADVGGDSNQGAALVFLRSGTVWSQQALLAAADGAANDQLGRAVSLSGDTALAGARFADLAGDVNRGAAYVFFRSSGSWSQQAKLTDPDGAAADQFGVSVAIEGDTALVGARAADVVGRPNEGAAWVFTRSDGVWSEQAKLTAADGAASAQPQFGISVALSGNTAVVGAFGAEVGGNGNQGAAYVFTRSGAVWSQQAKLTHLGADPTDEFGSAVAVDGDTALVGAFGDTSNRGAAYVFVRSGGVWSQQARLVAGDNAIGERFGSSVSLAGNTALIGAPLSDEGGNGNQGSAYVFTRSGTAWSQQAKLTAADGAAQDQFGISVALAGDTALVGAFGAEVGGVVNQGAAYVFTRSGTAWSQQAKLTAFDGLETDEFGRAVALEGDTALVGAFGDNADRGSAYVFRRSGGVWNPQAKFGAADAAPADRGGQSVDLAGDTALLGAPLADVGDNVDQGAAYAFVLAPDPGPGNAVLRFAPASLNFGDVAGGSESAPRTTTLINTGTVQVTGLTFSTPGNGFTLDTSACGTSLPPGGTCPISVVFTPASTGLKVATLQANSSQGLKSNVVVLAGNGVEPGEQPDETLVFSPPSLNFDNVEIGTESPALVTTLTNIGSAAATGLTFDLPVAPFAVDTSACGASLPAGASCPVSVTFTPAAVGLAIDSLQASAVGVVSNPVVLSGNGVDPDDPDLVLLFDPTSLDFGDVPLGTSGPTLTTTLTNTGDVAATGLAFNAPGSGFTVDSSDCGTTLPAGASCTVEVTFVPEVLGPATAALEAGSAEGLTSNFVTLTGRGTEGGGGGEEPILVFEPAGLDFGSIVVGEESLPLSVTLSNTGNADATGLGFLVSDGVFAADASACGTTLPAGASCEVSVTFAPAAVGPVSATLLAVAAAQGAVSNPVDLSGAGLPAGPGVPVLTMTPAELDFGNVEVGSTSSPLVATLSNGGDVAATGLTFAVSDPAFSADTSACGASLPAGASCAISVTFTPASPGVVSATLQASSAEGATVHLGLGGNGVDVGPGVPVLELAPSSLGFGSVAVGSSSPPLSATLTNSGDVAAEGLDFALSSGVFSADTSACGDLLSAGESCAIQVVFTPSALGPSSGTLLALAEGSAGGVTSNPVGLSGEGVHAGPGGTVLRFAPASLNFGDVEVGTESAPLITTLTNTGTTTITGLLFTPPGNGFAIDISGCGVLPPGGSCPVSVTFTPPATGMALATLRANSNTGLRSNVVVLAGNGVEPGEEPEETLVFSPASLNFDNVVVGTESAALVTTLTNIGSAAATGLTFDLPAAEFAVDTSACGASLPAGASCDVSVTFSPAVVDLVIDSLQASAVGVISNPVVLAGNGVEAGDPDLVLLFDPTSLDFGDVPLGTSGPTLTTTLTNTGDVDATGLAFNAPGSGFTVDSSACGTTLAAGASCTVEVTFAPPVLGPITAVLEAGSAEGLTSNFVLLSGRGTNDGGGGEDEPVLVFAPASLDFGSIVVGTESTPLSVTLSNVGDTDATGLGFAVSDGAFAADTSACGASLPAGVSCEVSVTFAPTVSGPVGATLIAVAAAQGVASTPVDLTGVGLPAGPGVPVLTMTPAELDFGNVEVGSTSSPLTATLTNSGDVAATDLTFTVSDPAFSADTSACGASLPAGASCAISVTFTPPAPGLVGASLQASSAEGTTVHLGLAGNGIDAGPGVAVLELAPSSLDFGSVPVGSISPALATVLTNSGDVAAAGLDFTVSSDVFIADASDCGDVLAAGASCEIHVVFTPSTLGPASGTLLALAGEGVDGVVSNPVGLAGTGVDSGPGGTVLQFVPASLNFGDVEVGTDSAQLTTELTNTGATEVTGLVFNTPGNGFSLDTSNCGASLPAGGSCSVAVVFTPAATGLSVATLQAESDEGLTSNVVVLAGNGVEPGEEPEETLVFSPATLNFDNVVVGTESPALVTTLTNIGSAAATGLTFDLPAAEFAVDTGDCGTSLPAGASCDVSVTFTPATLGLAIDSLQASAAGVISNPVVLAGNGVEAGDPDLVLVFEPTSLDFGDVPLGTSGPTLTTTLTNTGDVDATGLAFNIPGSGFLVDTGACGTSLPAGASCMVEVTFVPVVLGPVTAALEAGSAEGLTSNFVTLTGRGTDDGGGGGEEPELVFAPASLDFGTVVVGEESLPLSVTLSNTGDAEATGLGFAISDGVFAADTSACGTSLPAGASCDVSITFTPAAVGPVGATLIAVAAAQGAVSNPVDLTGVGLPAGPGVPVLTMTPPELDFGNVVAGSTSPPLTATLTNDGDVSATGLTFVVSDPAFSADTSACGASLPAGASCAIEVTFTPPAPGLVSASLQASSAGGATVNLGLGGNGVDAGPGVPVLELAPSSLHFGVIPVASSSPPLTTTLTNSGDVAAEGLAFAISNGVFSADTSDCGDVLAAGASCEVSIVFTPSALGPASGTLVALASEGVDGVVSNPVGLNGIGGPSGPQDTVLHFIPASLNFGDVEVGTESDPLTTTLINGGTTEVTGLAFSIPGNGFSVDAGDCGTTLPAGGSCDVLVAFSPTAPGLFVATLQADGDEGVTSNPVVLAGNGVEPGTEPEESLVFSPATLNFDNVEVGTESPALATTLTNIGDTAATGLSFDLPADGFTADTSDCGSSLPAGASCQVSVTFTPAAIGLAVDALQASAVGAISNPVVLAGNGVEPGGDPDLVLVFDPTELDFGDVELGATGPTLTTTLTNTGDVDANGLAFNSPGSGFTVDTGDCGTSLPAGASCEVAVTFVPQVLGPVTAALEAGSADGLTSNFVVLYGRGVEEGGGGGEPALVFDPSSLDFGFVEVGSSSLPQSAELTNIGDSDATELTFTVSNEDFEVNADACGDSLPAAASCEVSVVFSPSEIGPVDAEITAASAEDAAADLTLSGIGVVEGLFPLPLAVDAEEVISDGNNVFEPGERVEVAPEWFNAGSLPLFLGGTASDFTGPQGPSYTLVDDAADYGQITPSQSVSCRDTGDCYQMEVGPSGVPRPGLHWDTAFDETLSEGVVKPWVLHIGDSFLDVPRNNIFYRFIENLLHNRVTAGCTGTTYCPNASNTRAEMAVFVLKSAEGPGFQPSACEEGAEIFGDVPFDSIFCPWIEELAARQVVAGCGGGDYCPNAAVTRAQMAVFLLRTLLGPGYEPPACSGEFVDVECPSLFADWIEDLAARGITAGCTADQYCPAQPVTRAEMAVFLTKTFGLLLYGP